MLFSRKNKRAAYLLFVVGLFGLIMAVKTMAFVPTATSFCRPSLLLTQRSRGHKSLLLATTDDGPSTTDDEQPTTADDAISDDDTEKAVLVDEKEAAKYPINAPSPILLASAMLLVIASVGT